MKHSNHSLCVLMFVRMQMALAMTSAAAASGDSVSGTARRAPRPPSPKGVC